VASKTRWQGIGRSSLSREYVVRKQVVAKTSSFEKHAAEYDQWFEDHRLVYESELEVLKTLLPENGEGLEVGVGTGRFAAPLGIKTGVEPSQAMRIKARSRKIKAVDGTAEALPFPDKNYDYVLFVTTLCFVDSIEQAFKEASRVLVPGGVVLVGLIDADSPLGQQYEQKRRESRFYNDAVFHSVNEVVRCLADVGFCGFQFAQTLFHPLSEIATREPVEEGFGKGAFVVVRAIKPQ